MYLFTSFSGLGALYIKSSYFGQNSDDNVFMAADDNDAKSKLKPCQPIFREQQLRKKRVC